MSVRPSQPPVEIVPWDEGSGLGALGNPVPQRKGPASHEWVPTLHQAGLDHGAGGNNPTSQWLTQRRFISGSRYLSAAGRWAEVGGAARQCLESGLAEGPPAVANSRTASCTQALKASAGERSSPFPQLKQSF